MFSYWEENRVSDVFLLSLRDNLIVYLILNFCTFYENLVDSFIFMHLCIHTLLNGARLDCFVENILPCFFCYSIPQKSATSFGAYIDDLKKV